MSSFCSTPTLAAEAMFEVSARPGGFRQDLEKSPTWPNSEPEKRTFDKIRA